MRCIASFKQSCAIAGEVMWAIFAIVYAYRAEAEGLLMPQLTVGTKLLVAVILLVLAAPNGVALRPVNKDKKFAGSSIAQNVGDGLIFNSVWAFEIQ
jgi:hypothetical protein